MSRLLALHCDPTYELSQLDFESVPAFTCSSARLSDKTAFG